MYTWIVNHRGAATRCVVWSCTYVCCCTVCITAFTNNAACVGSPTHRPASLLVNFSSARSNWPFLNWYTLLRVIPTNTQFTCTQNINTAPDYSAAPEWWESVSYVCRNTIHRPYLQQWWPTWGWWRRQWGLPREATSTCALARAVHAC